MGWRRIYFFYFSTFSTLTWGLGEKRLL